MWGISEPGLPWLLMYINKDPPLLVVVFDKQSIVQRSCPTVIFASLGSAIHVSTTDLRGRKSN